MLIYPLAMMAAGLFLILGAAGYLALANVDDAEADR